MRYLIFFILVGCATLRFSRTGATQDEFMKDRYECLKNSEYREEKAHLFGGSAGYKSKVKVSCENLNSCLAAKGYTLNKTGNLSVPEDLEVECK